MLELIALAGLGAAGFGGMWLKTRRRTNHGNTRAAVDKFDGVSRQVSAAQARWYDLQIEAPIIAEGLEGQAREEVELAEQKARESSRALRDAWLPISDVDGSDVASYNDESREQVADYKHRALGLVPSFQRDLDALERLLNQHRQ